MFDPPKILVILNDPWKMRADDTAQMKKVNFFQTGKASTGPSKLENANFECTGYTQKIHGQWTACVYIYIYTYEPHMYKIYIYIYSLNSIIIFLEWNHNHDNVNKYAWDVSYITVLYCQYFTLQLGPDRLSHRPLPLEGDVQSMPLRFCLKQRFPAVSCSFLVF